MTAEGGDRQAPEFDSGEPVTPEKRSPLMGFSKVTPKRFYWKQTVRGRAASIVSTMKSAFSKPSEKGCAVRKSG